MIVRSLALVLSLIFCYFVFTSTTIPAEWKLPAKGPSHNNVTGQGQNVEEVIAQTSSIALGTSSSAATPEPIPASNEEEEKPKHWWSKPSGVAGDEDDKNKFVGLDVHSGAQFDIERSLKEVLDNMPDEIYTRDLLRGVTGGGEERLREVGLRTRLFKKFFTAWENLHLVSDGKNAYVRDNIVQYLRDAKDLSAVSELPKSDIIRLYEQYRYFLAQFSFILFPWTAPYFADHMTLHAQMYNGGRGIVLSGAEHQAPYMITAIASFRALGCTLPIEVMYLGDNDLPEEAREQMEAFEGVTTRNLKQMVFDAGWNVEGFASKAFSILMSSFREVLFLDADVLFFRNPEVLFEEQGYKDTGALFFRDRVVAPQFKKSFLRQILPKPISRTAQKSRYWTGESGEYQESGAIVVDKWRHFVSMLLVARMNGPDRADKDGNKGVYSFFYGDKETFWLGFELAGDTDYHFHQGDAGAMGVVKEVQRYMSIGAIAEDEEASSRDANAWINKKVNGGELIDTLETKPIDNSVKGAFSEQEKNAIAELTKVLSENQAASDNTEGDDDNNSGSKAHQEPSETNGESNDQKQDESSSSQDDTSNLEAHQKSSKTKGESKDQTQDESSSQKDTSDSESKVDSPKDPKDLTEYNKLKTFDSDGETSKSEVETNTKDKAQNNKDEPESSRSEVDANTFDLASLDDKKVDAEGSQFNKRDGDILSIFTDAKPIETVSALQWNMTYIEELTDVNMTMCSPQLLHLDMEGRPLWFNGWIQEDKFQNDAKVPVSKFQFFTSERREDDPNVFGHWDLGDHNNCCLRTDRVHRFEDNEQEVLDLIISIARENRAVV